MSGFTRAVVAVPLFLVYAAVVALYLVVYGLATIDDAGPLETTDGGWGFIILLVLALP